MACSVAAKPVAMGVCGGMIGVAIAMGLGIAAGKAGRAATAVPTTAVLSCGSARVSSGEPSALVESMALPLETLCKITLSASVEPTRYGRGGLPSTAINATPCRFDFCTTTPVSTKRLACNALGAAAVVGLALIGVCPPPKPLARACASTLPAPEVGAATAAESGAAVPLTNFSAQ